MAEFSRVHLVFNPAAGGGKGGGLLEMVCGGFRAAGCELELHRTEHAGHATGIVGDLSVRAGDVVCGLGGDGTMHEIVAGLMGRPAGDRPPVALLPGGSGNSLVHDLGTVRIEDALRELLGGRARPLDLMEVRIDGAKGHAFNIVGVGLAATAAARAERMRWLGVHRYTPAAAVEVMRGGRVDAEVTIDGQTQDQALTLLLVCNTQHTGRAMRAAPEARIDDGLLDAIVVPSLSRFRLLPLLGRLQNGSHVHSRHVQSPRIRSFAVCHRARSPVVVDGEVVQATTLEGRVLPGALRLLG